MRLKDNFYFQSILQVLLAILAVFAISGVFSTASTSALDEPLVKNMVDQKCSDSYTSKVPLDSPGFDDVIIFNGSYISLSEVDCEYIDRYEYDVGVFWNIENLKNLVSTAVISLPVIYSLILATPFLGLYDPKESKKNLKKYFRFGKIDILVPLFSLLIVYILEVITRLITSTYFTLPKFIQILLMLIPTLAANRSRVGMNNLEENKKSLCMAWRRYLDYFGRLELYRIAEIN